MSHNSTPPPPSSRSEGKIYRLKMNSESKILASKAAERESLKPPPVPKGLELIEVQQEVVAASNTLEQAVSDQTHAVYLVISKLDTTSERQERIFEGQNRLARMMTFGFFIMLVCLACLLVLLLSSLQIGS